MYHIINQVIEEKKEYQGEVILTYRIEYPEITEVEYILGKEIFNRYNKFLAMELQQYCENELFEQAKQTYQYNKEHGYPIMVYELILEYKITFHNSYMISLYMDQYEFTGGAHGSTIRTSQNWDLQKGIKIPIQAFFQNDPYYTITILKQINEQIAQRQEKEQGTYFDHYCQLVLESINFDHYYITNNGIVIFFQAYEIAPYSTGIPTFLISR